MQAVVITRPGGPEVLQMRDISDPIPGPCQVIVQVRAAGVNRADLLQRRGLYPPPAGAAADRPGLEFAGYAAETGDAVRSLQPGDRVMGIVESCAAAWEFHQRVLRERGRLVLLGLLGGSKLNIDLFRLMRKRLTVVGTVLRSRSLEEEVALVEEFSGRTLPLIAEGVVSPVVHSVFDLDRAGEAHALMERDENFGKIVLRV